MLKCNISRNKFTGELEALLLTDGRRMYEEGRVEDLESMGNGLWVARINANGRTFEVETVVRSSIFRQVGCDCEDHHTGKLCTHVVALIYALDDRLPRKALPENRPAPVPASPQVGQLIRLLPPDRLPELMARFAKKHRRISLMIRGVALPYMAGDEHKYKELLHNVLKSAGVDRRLPSSGLVTVSEVVKAIVNELDWLLQSGYTEEVRFFADAFLGIWPSLSRYELPKGRKIDNLLDKVMALVANAIELVRAPEAVEKTGLAIGKHLAVFASISPAAADKLLELLGRMALDEGSLRQIFDKLVPVLERGLPFERLKKVLSFFAGENMPAAQLAGAFAEGWSVEDGLAFCTVAVEKADFELLNILIQKIRARSPEEEILNALTDFELLAVQATGSRQDVIALAELNLKKTGDVKYFNVIKEMYEGDFKSFARRLYDDLGTSGRFLPGALVLIELGDFDELFAHAERTAHVAELPRVDSYLFRTDTPRTEALYEKLLTGYLDNHLGSRPAGIFERLMNHLDQTGHSDFGSRLRKMVNNRYGHRPLLKKQLDV